MTQSSDSDLAAELVTEVELSAADLEVLAPPAAAASQADSAAPVQSVKAVAAAAAPARMPSSLRGRITRLQVAGMLGLAIVAGVSLSVHNESPPVGMVQPAASEWIPISSKPATGEAEHAHAPTLFANPFDETEIFELAPGLSDEEARQVVANLLIERARERGVY
jgi:hypothetical protein